MSRGAEVPTADVARAVSGLPGVMSARIIVLAGVNGAGKNSVAGAAILRAGGEFYNPDSAARELLDSNPSLTVEQANGQAWELGRRGLERALAQGEFFAFE